MEIILNAVNSFSPYDPVRLMLLPSLNTYRIDMAYEAIINEPDYTVHMVDERALWKTFFCKMNGQVYEIVTNQDVTVVHRVQIPMHSARLFQQG